MAERHYIVMACELWYNRVVYDNSPKLIYKLDRTDSFATHLMEQGIERQNIQALLGHRDPKSTEVYLHVSNKSLMGIQSPFDRKEGAGHE